MDDETGNKIANVLKELGYKDVSYDCGYVYYTELDGTKHRLVEDILDENGWVSDKEH